MGVCPNDINLNSATPVTPRPFIIPEHRSKYLVGMLLL